jgi:hypothetical protein
VRIDLIVPYGKNARNNQRAIPAVTESIKEFGLRGQIVLESRKNPTIVAGHTRWAACKALGWTEIPDERIDYAEDLTPTQIKAFRLADNKTAELSRWNTKLLKAETEELISEGSLDMSKFGFDLSDPKSKNERMRTDDAYNLRLLDGRVRRSEFGVPHIRGNKVAPAKLIPFNYARTAEDFACGIHFFIDDYQFERVWNRPEHYVELLKKFECVLAPDFSLYMDMPLVIKLWNVYRSRVLAKFWQRRNVKVVPVLQWAGKDTYEFAFDGIAPGSPVAVSAVGVRDDKTAVKFWRAGMTEAMKVVKPGVVLLYGDCPEFDFGSAEVLPYASFQEERFR